MATKKHKERQRAIGNWGFRFLDSPFRAFGGHLPLTLVAVIGLLLAPAVLRGQGYSPAEAPGKMKLPEGFSAKLVASEPLIRQPVAIDFDDRGRLWVMQYLQYPNPAGLERVKVDRFSRTKYDKVPEPPPKGPKGEDRLTIVEDRNPTRERGTDSDTSPTRERGNESKDFLSNLNLASAFQFGHGGVYVLNPPYLLFYADKNRDDVPDGDPEVLLTGFGMDDAHSVANSLTWGPDGWLYGCQGSTVTANIRGIEFQQGVWRFHPRSKEFELFCEGGGNSWGLDFDDDGNFLYSTNHGGFVMLHGVQGAYLWKQFGKHGELHNPHAYGYFDHVPHQNFFGGHVTVGGIVYRGDAYPEKLHGKYIAGDLLGHGVYWHDIEPRGTTFQTKHGGELLVANDTWFATSDVCLGPDGFVYVADWHDKRTAHPDPDADWDRRNGRVYKIEYSNPQRQRGSDDADTNPTRKRGSDIPDFAKLSSDDLIKLLFSQNHWLATRARRILGERQYRNTCAPLEKLVRESKDDHDALKALWALDVSGGFSESLGCEFLDHKSPLIRRWVVRLLGDPKKVTPETASRLRKLAQEDDSPLVRSQLACTAKRLPTMDALPIIRCLLSGESGDEKDPYIPLLLWWAVEQHCIAAELDLPNFLTQGPAAKNSLVKETILPRLVRRYMAEGDEKLEEAMVEILTQASQESWHALWVAMELGMQQRPNGKARLGTKLMATLQGHFKEKYDFALLRLLVTAGNPEATQRALEIIADKKAPLEERIPLMALMPRMLQMKAPNGSEQNWPNLSDLLSEPESESVKLAAIATIVQFGSDNRLALLKTYSGLTDREKGAVRSACLQDRKSALLFLILVDEGRFSAKDVSIEELRVVANYDDPKINALVQKHWGKVAPPTKEEILADIRRLNNDLRAFPGDAKNGKVLFTKHCATCHKLFGEGAAVGPDLTFANRTDRDYLLISTVDPSAVVRKEFQSHVALLKNGTVVTGLIVENKPPKMVFVDSKGQKAEVAHSDIDRLQESSLSLMPDNILKQFKPEELRDLFAYLQSKP